MRKIAHRGASGYETENTAKAIKKALELRVDMIELDVRRCATGEFVIFHDPTVERVTDGKGAVKNLLYSRIKRLRTIDGQKILTLPEALEIIGGRCWVNLHLKSSDSVPELLSIVRESVESKKWTLKQFLISSFSPKDLKQIKKIEPGIKTGLLYYRPIRNILKKAQKLSVYSIHLKMKHVKKKIIDSLRVHDIKSFAWTVNSAADAKQARKLGVDGIISDFPDIV